VLHQQATGRKKRELEREQANLRAQADAIARQLAGIGAEIQLVKKSDAERQHMMTEERKRLAQARKAD
jgi:hypothetical protein